MSSDEIRNLEEFDVLPFEPRMAPSEPDKLNGKRTILISLSFFIVLFAWSYFNFKVPLILDDVLGTLMLKDMVKGIIMAMDNLIAVILQPYFGDLSDRTKSKIGRRMPYIIIGASLAAIFFMVIPWIRVLAGLILIIFLFDLAMSTFRSSSIAILPDYTPEKMYSKGSAIQQFIANMGGLIAFTIPIFIGTLEGSLDPLLFDALGFIIVGIGMFILVLIQIFTVKETPTGEKFIKISPTKIEIDPITFKARQMKQTDEDKKSKHKLRSYRDAFHIVKQHKDFKFFLCTIIFMYLAFASIESFFSSFAVAYFQIKEGAAGTLFLAYSGPMIASAYFVGLLGQAKSVGRKKAVKIFLSWLILSVFIMAVLVVPTTFHNHNPLLVTVVLVLIAIPWMGFIVNSFPILWSLAPKGKVGIYTGIYYTFNQTAYTIAPILFGGILSAFSAFGDFRYIIMFPFILILIVIALLFFSKVKSGESRE
ncbi:MAG: MFS transporter [Promethearchaeota archaeon]